MKKRFITIALILLIFIQCKQPSKRLQFSKLPEKSVVDTFFRKKIIDPYRYMENAEDAVVLNWYKNQNLITKNTIAQIANKDKLSKLQEK